MAAFFIAAEWINSAMPKRLLLEVRVGESGVSTRVLSAGQR